MLAALSRDLAIILILTLANGFFAGAEIAIVSARRGRLELRAHAGDRAARQALELAENPDRFLATVQVGISLIGTFTAAFGGAQLGEILAMWLQAVPVLASYTEPIALGVVVIVITYLSLVLGELVPKRLALQHAERVASLAAPVMTSLAVAARPVVAILSMSVRLVLRLLGQQHPKEPAVTEEDISYMVRKGAASGAVELGEAQLIKRVFQFTDRPVRLVMTPRSEITAVEVGTDWAGVVRTFVQSGYSRIPVYQGTLDHVVGVLHVKDVLCVLAGAEDRRDLMQLVRPATFVLESQPVDDVLTMFRREGIHLALVVDEYGQIAGLVTLEDLLEELVGEIHDEYDRSEELPIVQREDGTWLVDGMEAYDKVRDLIGLPAHAAADQQDFTTLAGLILSTLGRIPQVGDSVSLGDYILEVVDMDGRRIDKVLVRPQRPTEQTKLDAIRGPIQ